MKFDACKSLSLFSRNVANVYLWRCGKCSMKSLTECHWLLASMVVCTLPMVAYPRLSTHLINLQVFPVRWIILSNNHLKPGKYCKSSILVPSLMVILCSLIFTCTFRWNDPITQRELANCPIFVRADMDKMNGFLPNLRRGTAFLYGEKAVTRFCDRNNLDFILRAHELFNEGFQFFIQGRVVSVFSSSNYAGLSNSASVLFVNQHRIRVIRIERENIEKTDNSIRRGK